MNKYRIVRDSYRGFEVQISGLNKWKAIGGPFSDKTNTSSTLEDAKELMMAHKEGRMVKAYVSTDEVVWEETV